MFDFEKAIRSKIRFSYKGQLSVEDLWDLSLAELDEIYSPLQTQLDQSQKGSLLGVKTKNLDLVTYKIDILKHIALVKKEEVDKKERLAANKAKKAKLLDLLERKRNLKLENMPENQIESLINALDSEEAT